MRSFKMRFLFHILPLVFAICLIFLFVSIRHSANLLSTGLLERGQSLAKSLSFSCQTAVVSKDSIALALPLEGILEEEDALYAAVYTQHGELLAQRKRIPSLPELSSETVQTVRREGASSHKKLVVEGGALFDFLSPITTTYQASDATFGGQLLGFTRVGLSLQKIPSATWSSATVGALITVLVIAGGALLSFLLSVRISHPVRELAHAMREISEGEGDLTRRFQVASRDELGELADSFNKFAEGIGGIVRETSEVADSLASHAEQLSAGAQELNASAEDISATTQTIAQGASRQSEEVNSTLEATKKVSDLAVTSTRKADEAENLAGSIASLAKTGRTSAEDALSKVETITELTKGLKSVVEEVNERSERIVTIIETIEDITKTTNILALNAAIEAARAGEYGKGFEVVADEVKKLAEKSSAEAAEIATIVGEIRESVGKMVDTASRTAAGIDAGRVVIIDTAEKLKAIADQVSQSAQGVREIRASSGEQKGEIEKLVRSIEEIAAVAQENAASSQEVSAAIEEQTASIEELSASTQELSTLAEKLKNLIARFKYA